MHTYELSSTNLADSAIGRSQIRLANCDSSSCFAAFRTGIDRAKITLPDGQLTHVLRHTFASHFMMNGGNILALQRILGHQSLTMAMGYAHLAPNHLKEAKHLNPLTLIGETNANENEERAA